MTNPAVSTAPLEPRRASGGAAGARGRGWWVKYPLRVVIDADAYAPTDTNIYGKVSALAQRGVCTAAVEYIAAFLGVSKATVERALRRLGMAVDGVTELFTRRRTHTVTGTGQTAERWVRQLQPGEVFVWAPMLAGDTLRGPLHRLYLALRHAQRTGHQPTLAELAQLLRHHSGPNAGTALAEATVTRMLRKLEQLGWISLNARGGYRGRHHITVHDHPIHDTGDLTAPDASPDADDGSGPDLGDGSLANKEDQELNDGRDQAGGPFRRRRDTCSGPEDPPTTPPVTFEPAAAAPPAERVSPYGGPGLQLSPRVWRVLDPVRYLLPGIRTWILRRVAKEIGRQLDTYATEERLTARLQWRYAQHHGHIRDTGRWLLAVGLAHWGCGHLDCEAGTRWTTGQRCAACADNAAQHRATAHPPHTSPPVPPTPRRQPTVRVWHECGHCGRPSPIRAHTDGLCADCRPPTPPDTTARRYPA